MSSFVDHLLETRTPLELARMLVQTARENAALRDKVSELQHALFWNNVKQQKESK
jgi:hypothetical protein